MVVEKYERKDPTDYWYIIELQFNRRENPIDRESIRVVVENITRIIQGGCRGFLLEGGDV